jgi:hypothetical protein
MSNAGMILNETNTSDDGVFRVLVQFTSGPAFEREERLNMENDTGKQYISTQYSYGIRSNTLLI